MKVKNSKGISYRSSGSPMNLVFIDPDALSRLKTRDGSSPKTTSICKDSVSDGSFMDGQIGVSHPDQRNYES